ncbi:MAG: M24 family metallopeptidase [Acidimicrobiales bacterium]
MTIEVERLERLRSTMASRQVAAVLTADPINVLYATGVRNMTIYSMMGAFRFALVFADGPVVLWEFAGSEHVAADRQTVNEVRTAPGLTAVGGPAYLAAVDDFAIEVADLLRDRNHSNDPLGIEAFDHPVTDALRRVGIELQSATEVFVEARRRKTPLEITAMRTAMTCVTAAADSMFDHVEPGLTEVEVWAEFHRRLIAADGEYVSTRLVQAGPRTFPYFNEAGHNVVVEGDLFCIDTDAIGPGSYGVDFSRSVICGDVVPTRAQRHLMALASEQATHNGAMLEPGCDFEAFARRAWEIPDRFAPYGYYCLAHGLGLNGEYPYIPVAEPGRSFPLPGAFEPGMVICIESYIGDPETHQGVKVEDQYLITETGADLMSTMPHERRT